MLTHTYLPDMQSHQSLKKCVLGVMIVSEPDPQKNQKGGSGKSISWGGSVHCTIGVGTNSLLVGAKLNIYCDHGDLRCMYEY